MTVPERFAVVLGVVALGASPATASVRVLAPVSRTSGCVVRGALPDRRCTPGSVIVESSRSVVCVTGYSATVRSVSDATKERVYRAYGIASHSRETFEMDHLVPLELGGSNDESNLFPEAADPRPGFHEKDVVENRLRRFVCVGGWRLAATQKAVAFRWLKFWGGA